MDSLLPIGRFKAAGRASEKLAGHALLYVTLLALVAIGFVFCAVLQSSYYATQELAIQTSTNIAALIEQQITRNIETYDLALQGVIAGLNDPRVMALEPDIRRIALFDRSALADGLGAIIILDENGDMVMHSWPKPLAKANFADRDYFQAQKASADLGLVLSAPVRGRVDNDKWMLMISRRLSHPDGRFAGVVVGTILQSYFQGILSKADVGHKGAVSLFNEDRQFIARYPRRDSIVGSKIPPGILLNDYRKAPTGNYEATALDGIHRLYIYRKIGKLPLILNVGLATDEIFASWWSKAWIQSASFIALCALVLVLIVLAGGELRKRRAAEDALAILAATDPLTGLANRRTFDARLEHEWARARRNGAPLSLLMLDTDFFKSFNDTLGHQAGDIALQAVAQCLQAKIKRSSDLAARYGGEEFCVLLPDTPLEGAMRVAEMLHCAVSDLNLPHQASVRGILTVSVGVACRRPDHAAPSDLMRDADRALYIAKTSGRDRVADAAAPDGPAVAPKPFENLSALASQRAQEASFV